MTKEESLHVFCKDVTMVGPAGQYRTWGQLNLWCGILRTWTDHSPSHTLPLECFLLWLHLRWNAEWLVNLTSRSFSPGREAFIFPPGSEPDINWNSCVFCELWWPVIAKTPKLFVLAFTQSDIQSTEEFKRNCFYSAQEKVGTPGASGSDGMVYLFACESWWIGPVIFSNLFQFCRSLPLLHHEEEGLWMMT